jgi:hypothetical protein
MLGTRMSHGIEKEIAKRKEWQGNKDNEASIEREAVYVERDNRKEDYKTTYYTEDGNKKMLWMLKNGW